MKTFYYVQNIILFIVILVLKNQTNAATISSNQLMVHRRIQEGLGQNHEEDGRVVGGSDAEPNQFPFIVSLLFEGHFICGGSILTRYWIVTAAHCVYGASVEGLAISAGSIMLSEPGYLYPVASYIIHEDYHRFDLINDVAVIRLNVPLKFSWSVHAIEMSTADLGGNTPCILAGWGRKVNSIPDPSNHLQFIALNTILQADCRRLLAEFPIQSSQVCTLTRKGEGACKGDSGGPLVSTDNKLIGIVSYGRPCAKGYPDVFTRISSFVQWINNQIKA